MEGQAQQIDMNREFTCYLCNGYALTVGSIVMTVVGIKLVNAVGQVLEMDPFELIVSVNEIEPENSHTLVISFDTRYVMLSCLIRKEMLVDIFKDIGLYKSEPKLPPEAIGMYCPNVMVHTDQQSTAYSVETNRDNAHQYETAGINNVTEEGERGYEEGEGGYDQNNGDTWDNRTEQDRHIQRQIRQQSVLNPIQMLSSLQQQRASNISNEKDYQQQHKYTNTTLPKDNRLDDKNKKSSSVTPLAPTDKHGDSPYHSKELSPSSSTPNKPSNHSTVLSNLKLIFPNHKHDQLLSILVKCDYNLDAAVSSILGDHDLANSPTTQSLNK